MDFPKTNEEFDTRVDELCSRLTEIGMNAEADRISFRLHKVSWTTSAELFWELYLELRQIPHGPNAQKLPAAVENDLANCIDWLARADPLNWTPEVGPPCAR